MVVFICACPATVRAQYWRGYFFLGPTAWSEPRAVPGKLTESTTTFSIEFGAGLERLLYGGIGIGADLQGVSPGEQRFSDAAGLASVNAFYHFRRRKALDPFVTAGYTFTVPVLNARSVGCGGGINYWFDERAGVLLEFREYLPTASQPGHSYHVAAIRFGLVLR